MEGPLLRRRKLSEGHETEKGICARTKTEGPQVKIKRGTGKRTTQRNDVVPIAKERGINPCAVNNNIARRTDSFFVEASKSAGPKSGRCRTASTITYHSS